jgi:TolB-like protein/Flp pilus assembly protein TadD
MFTDMVGYTALGQRNESLSLALMEEHRKVVRPILSKHDGREVKTMGDAFLVEFPNALEAVRCAYDIQRAVREFNFSLPEDKRIHLRIGVHLGDVVESAGDIVGDAVNVASRIEPLAEDGGVCISRQVYDQVQNKLELPLRGMGTRILKNIALPVEVYAIAMPWEDTNAGQPPLDRRRIAVLPFANMSPDPGDEYFADGLTEELIDRLCQVGELEVIARTSVISYKGKDKKASEIARELGAGSIVEGSVRKAGNKVRVTAQLVNGATEGHVWSSRYDKNLDDIFAVQTDIAEQVTEALKVRLLPSERAALQKKATESAEAHILYLKGRYYWNERTKESLEKAVGYFAKALEKDTKFALAYAGLADSYTIMLDRGFATRKDVFELSLANGERAVEIDESLAEGHLALGGVYEHNYQWSSAESEFKKALELNPNLAQAHHWLGVQYSVLDRWDEAIEEDEKALALDPLSKLLRGVTAYDMVIAGRVSEGLKAAEGAVEEHPDEYWGHLALSLACLRESQNERAIAEAKIGYSLSGGHPWPMAFLLYILRETGNLREAEEAAKNYLSTDGARPWNLSQLAMVYLCIDDKSKAFELLNEAYKRADPGLIYLGWPPVFDSVRSDPRFLELYKKVKPA